MFHFVPAAKKIGSVAVRGAEIGCKGGRLLTGHPDSKLCGPPLPDQIINISERCAIIPLLQRSEATAWKDETHGGGSTFWQGRGKKEDIRGGCEKAGIMTEIAGEERVSAERIRGTDRAEVLSTGSSTAESTTPPPASSKA